MHVKNKCWCLVLVNLIPWFITAADASWMFHDNCNRFPGLLQWKTNTVEEKHNEKRDKQIRHHLSLCEVNNVSHSTNLPCVIFALQLWRFQYSNFCQSATHAHANTGHMRNNAALATSPQYRQPHSPMWAVHVCICCCCWELGIENCDRDNAR